MQQNYKNKIEQLLQQHTTHYYNMQIEATETHTVASKKAVLLQHHLKPTTTFGENHYNTGES
jgi:hypothetical protein